MPLTNYSLNKYVAQELSDLKNPLARSVRGEFPNLDKWICTFVMKSIFHLDLTEKHTTLAFALIRRAQAAIEDYDEACTALSHTVGRESTITEYFHTLRKLESSVAMLYQAYNFAIKALSIRLFATNDGSNYQRLNSIYNSSRHPDVMKLPSGHLHPVWIKNDGLYTNGTKLRFDELEDMLRELGRIAEYTSNGNIQQTLTESGREQRKV